jgi:hypothetical protein
MVAQFGGLAKSIVVVEQVQCGPVVCQVGGVRGA